MEQPGDRTLDILREIVGARIERGLSYRSLARKTGLRSPNYLQRIIKKEVPLSFEVLLRITYGLNLPEDLRETLIGSFVQEHRQFFESKPKEQHPLEP
jgi:transcriptional regulator with XRE-family HTH domain